MIMMKCCKYLFLAMCLITASTSVQAETIDSNSFSLDALAGAPGSVTNVCMKVAFIKRNSGTLITGLATAKIKPFRITESTINPTTGTQISKNFNMTYSLAASTLPAEPGVYDFCVKPSGVGNVWKKPGGVGYFYTIDAVVHGILATDNGVFSVTLR
jgi:hypothetical protein